MSESKTSKAQGATAQLSSIAENFERLFSYLPVGLAIVDSKKRILLRNISFNYTYMLNEYADDQIIKIKECEKLTRSGFADSVDQCFNNRDIVECELNITTDLEQLFCKLTFSPFLDENNAIEFVTVSIEDIGKLKDAQETAENLQEKLSVQKTNTPLAYIECDENFEIREWNQAAEKMFGYKNAEAVGKNIFELTFTSNSNENQSEFYQSFEKKANDGNLYANFIKSGDRIHCKWYNSKITSNSGKLLAYSSLILNITEQLAAEQALKENEKIFRTVVESQADGIVQVSVDEIFELSNPAMGEILECDYKELKGKSFMDFVAAEDREHLSQETSRRILGYKNDYELKIVTAKGKEKWISISATPQLDNAGVFIGAFGIIKDISDRKNAELLLKENQERFNTIFSFSKDMVNILDEKGSMSYFSPNCSKVLGRHYSVDEIINPFNFVHPEDKEQMAKDFGIIIEKSEQLMTRQYRYRKGESENDYLWLETIGINLLDNPNIKGILLTSRDISDRKNAEDALRQSEKNFRIVVNNSNVLIFILDKNGKILLSEGKALSLFKFKPGQIVGLTIYDIFDGDEQAKQDVKLALSGQEISSILHIQDYTFVSYYSPYYNANGEYEGVVAIATDNTERIKAEEEKERLIEDLQYSRETIIEEANKLIVLNDKILESEAKLSRSNAEKDKFFSIISHDLRSPLSGIMGLAETLNCYFDKYSQEELKSTIDILFNSSKHLYKLLENLLLWSRMQRGALDFTQESFNINSMAQNSIELLINNAIQKNIKIINNIQTDIVVFADENMTNTVIRNLVSNAIKFTNPGGEIRLDSELQGSNSVLIKIKDNGVGMSQDVVDKLFRIDVHYTSLGTDNEQGAGIGLILCYDMIKKNGGEIYLKSEPDKGSEFSFTLPLSVRESNIINGDEDENTSAETLSPKERTFVEILEEYKNEKQELSAAALSALPMIIEILEFEYMETRNVLLNTLIISDIIAFARDLQSFADEYKIEFVLMYANTLYDKAKLMDIKSIDELLNTFPNIIDILKSYLNEK
jgi:PAS domain S-box-containing protein